MSANIKASTDGTQAIIGVGGVDQMTVSNAGVVTANSFVGLNGSSVTATGTTEPRNLQDRFADVVNVLDFGADPTGVVDSSVAFQNAINSLGTTGGRIRVPSGVYKFLTGIVIDKFGVWLDGSGPKNTQISPAFSDGDVITFIPPTGEISNLCSSITGMTIDPPVSFPRNSGAHIRLTNVRQFNMQRMEIRDCFIGIHIDGSLGAHQVFEDIVIRNAIPDIGVCILLEDGHDQMFNYISINNPVGQEPLAGFRLIQNKALWLDNSDILRCKYGMLIEPGENQIITFAFIDNTAFDYCSIDGIRIAATDPTAIIKGLQFSSTWTSSCTERGFHIAGLSEPDGIYINGHRAVNNGSNGFLATTGNDIKLNGFMAAGNGKSATGTISGIQFNNISNFSVIECSSGSFMGYGPTQSYGLLASGSVDKYIITNNDFTGNATNGINPGSGASKIIHSNIPEGDWDRIVVGGGIGITRMLKGSDIWDPTILNPGDHTGRTITVNGASVGDFVLASHTSIVNNDIQVSANVVSPNTVRVFLHNISSIIYDLPSGTVSAFVIKSE